MGREPQTVHQFTHKQHEYALEKEHTVIRCDDGAVYEFVQPDGRPRPRFVRSFDPSGEMKNTGSHKRIASAVEETVDTLFNGWEK